MIPFLGDLGAVRRIVSATTRPFLAALLIVCGLGTTGGLLSRAGADSGGSPGAWIVGDSIGHVEVQVADGSAWMPAEPGVMLQGPAVVRTGPDGRATLTREDDRILLSPTTEIQLPGPSSNNSTRIVQSNGEAFFEVGPRPGWTFSVDTPYLAVVVKGTKFGVGVSDAGTSVSVSEGRVQVGRADGNTADISAGQTARTDAAPGSDISVSNSTDASAAAPEAAPSAADTATSAAEGGAGAAAASGSSAGNGSGTASAGGSSGSSSDGSSSGSGSGSAGGSSGSGASTSGESSSSGSESGSSDSSERSSSDSSGSGSGKSNERDDDDGDEGGDADD